MSQYVPDSTVKLYRVEGLDTKSGRTLAFVNAAARDGWMNGHIWPSAQYGTSVNVQVVKKRFQTIRLKMNMMQTGGNDTLQFCNYLSFINPSYGNKVYYCNITNYDYINNETVEISYSIDWWMTDMFTADIEACSILREGFTIGEFNALKNNPYQDIIKMRTDEPIACTSETESLKKRVAGNNGLSELNDWNKFDGWNVFNQKVSVYKDGSSYMWGGGTADTNYEATSTPFYIISFAGTIDGDGGNSVVVQNAFMVLDDYLDSTTGSGSPFLKMTPQKFSAPAGGGASMDAYAKGRHAYTSGGDMLLSYSDGPCQDTKYARPYFVLGTTDLTTLQKITEVFANYDDVASILSIYSMPLSILGEFISCAFDHPHNSLSAEKMQFLRVPFPNVYKDVKGTWSYWPVTGVHPKLYRFPFSYASLDGINGSGHIELQFEKMGNYDPNASTPLPADGDGCRLDSNGKPSYWVLRKFVSITASGIFAGAAPVDYDGRIYDHDPYFECKTNLAQGVFYTEFPQVPYNTDAFAEFLGSQAKQITMNYTEMERMEQNNAYNALYRGQYDNIMGAITGGGTSLSRAAGGDYLGAGTGAVGGFVGYVSGENNRIANMNMIENQRKLSESSMSYLGSPNAGQDANLFTDNFRTAKRAFVSPNYHSGSSDGIINLIRGVEPIGVNVNIHFRAPSMINQYNAFLNMYGMATQEFKKPAITYFIAHDESNAAAPKFSGDVNAGDTWSGTTPVNHIFYTQTENAHVSGVCADSSKYIENMLNGGVQFVDTLTRPS